MKNKRSYTLFGIMLAAVIVFSMAACPDDVKNDTKKPDGISVKIILDASSPSVLRGGNLSLTASVKGAKDKTVTWYMDTENKHKDTTITIEGIGAWLNVAEDEKLGTLTIRAVSNENPDKSDSKRITIPVPRVDNVKISLLEPWVVPWQGIIDVAPGGAMEFTAKVEGGGFIRDAITWSIVENDLAEGTCIDEEGNLTVSKNEPEHRTFTVQAVSKWNESEISIVTVTVQEPQVKGVVIYDKNDNEVTSDKKTPRKVKTSDSETFRAVVTGTGKVAQDITWDIERISYKFWVDEVKPLTVNDESYLTDGWGEEVIEIGVDGETELLKMWCTDGDFYPGTTILKFEQRPIERIPGSKEIIIWKKEIATDASYFDEEGIEIVTESHFESVKKKLEPMVTGTGFEDGTFTVSGLEVFGKFKLSATAIDSTTKKEIIVEVDSSTDVDQEIPKA
jgi:hypothetical protein